MFRKSLLYAAGLAAMLSLAPYAHAGATSGTIKGEVTIHNMHEPDCFFLLEPANLSRFLEQGKSYKLAADQTGTGEAA